MLRSRFCNYNDSYILAKGIITVEAQAGNNPNHNDNEVVLKKLGSIY